MNQTASTENTMSLEQAMAVAIEHHQAGRLEEAANLYRQILRYDPLHAEAMHLLGVACDQEGDSDAALEWIGKSLSLQPRNAEAQNNYGLALIAKGDEAGAIESFKAAVAIDERYAQGWFNLGNLYKNRKAWKEAEQYFRKAAAAWEGYADAWYGLGAALAALGRHADAEEALRQAARLCPDHPPLWNDLAISLHQQDNYADAEKAYRRALELKPDYPEALANLAQLCRRTGQDDQARQYEQHVLRHVSAGGHTGMEPLSAMHRDQGNKEQVEIAHRRAVYQKNPRNAAACFALGTALMPFADGWDEAIGLFREALAINPLHSGAWSNLGRTYSQKRQWRDAEEALLKALEIEPHQPLTVTILSDVYKKQGKFAESEALLNAALNVHPNSAELHYYLGLTHAAQVHWKASRAQFERAIALKPDYAEVHNQLGYIHAGMADIPKALECYRRALECKPDFSIAHGNILFAMHYDSRFTPQDLRDEAVAWGRLHAPPSLRLPPTMHDATPGRRLRIGYVSGDFRQHPVASFFERVLACHDHAAHEITCYHNSADYDATTQRIQVNADRWRDTVSLSDDEVAALIRKDAIDILVDLSGHTAQNRLGALARKPAPVQATWLGYFDTIGCEAIDYIIADRYVIPETEEALYLEKPARLPGSYLCFTLPNYAIDVAPPPVEKNGYITFGCFNYLSKVTEQVVASWAKIMQGAPDSRLFLKTQSLSSEEVCARYYAMFAAHGIGAQRLRFEGPARRNQLIACYNEVDLALDPFPYNGGTTTVEALWMGVPVITYSGDRFVTHVGDSILSTVGLPDLVARAPEEYCDKALALAQDRGRLASLRRSLRATLEQSPLCDTPRFTRDLEALYRNMWHGWCAEPS